MSVMNVKFGSDSVHATITGGEVTIEETSELSVHDIMKMLNGLDEINRGSECEDDWTVLFMNHRGAWVAETDNGYAEFVWSDGSEQWI